MPNPVIDMEKRGGRWRTPRPLWAQAVAPLFPALTGIWLLVALLLALRGPAAPPATLSGHGAGRGPARDSRSGARAASLLLFGGS